MAKRVPAGFKVGSWVKAGSSRILWQSQSLAVLCESFLGVCRELRINYQKGWARESAGRLWHGGGNLQTVLAVYLSVHLDVRHAGAFQP
jgi:hypothetical protein